jgi:hypothetical protein
LSERALRFTLATLLGVSACGEAGGAPVINGISPLRAYSDFAVLMAIKAEFRPELVVDIAAESASYDDGTIHAWLVGETPGLPSAVSLGTTAWNGIDTYLVTVPQGTAPGLYAVRVDAPNGRSTTLHGAFEELGADTFSPLLFVQRPSATDTLGANTAATAGMTGTSFTGMIFVDDDPGHLREVDWWTSDNIYGSCPLLPLQLDTMAPPSQISCKPDFMIAPLPDGLTGPVPFSFHVVAIDVSGQMASQDVTLSVAPIPVVDSFEGPIGALAGLQQFVVHGRYFFPGSQAFIDGVPLMGDTVGGDRLDDQTIVGLTPPRSVPNTVLVEVRNPGLTPVGVGRAAAAFRYLAPPQPRIVEPSVGPTSGAILVTIAGNDLTSDVSISFGLTQETAQPMCIISYVAGDKVTGYPPPGQGTVSIWATNPVTGTGVFAGAFTYSDDAVDGGAVPSPPPCPAATTP